MFFSCFVPLVTKYIILLNMLSKEERKELNTAFWSSFKTRMRKIDSSTGRGINWINYPLYVKDMYIRMEVDGKKITFALDIQPKDDGIRSILYEQMTELRRLLEEEMGPATEWSEFFKVIQGRNVSRIYWQTDSNFYDKNNWEEIQQYLEDKLVAFDEFYQEYKEIIIALAE